MDIPRLIERLKLDEGWSAVIYIDDTGNLTIGFGYNLGKLILPEGIDLKLVSVKPVNGISKEIGELLLSGFLMKLLIDLTIKLPWLKNLDDVRQRVIANMAYNLGVDGLLLWPIFLRQTRNGEWLKAAHNMRSTRWFRQVGSRGRRLANMMETGKDPE